MAVLDHLLGPNNMQSSSMVVCTSAQQQQLHICNGCIWMLLTENTLLHQCQPGSIVSGVDPQSRQRHWQPAGTFLAPWPNCRRKAGLNLMCSLCMSP